MRKHRFSRLEQLVTPKGLDKLKNSFVVICGLGATGSYATEALARAGIGKLRLIDFDEISITNINRQLYALDSTIGKAKVDAAQKRIKDINPDCLVEPLKEFINADKMEFIFRDQPDILIDCIDSLNPKVELLAEAMNNKPKIISCMGAALRTDPSNIKVGKLKHVHHCRLAKHIRKRLRKKNVPLEMQCVYSTEDYRNIPEEAIGNYEKTEDRSLDHGRKRRIIGSLPTITGIFGLTAANEAIQTLTTKE